MSREKQIITEEMNLQEEWFNQAKNIKLNSLQEFIDHLLNDYEHDYGTICHAIAAGSIATAWSMNEHEQGGITGFQAWGIMWDFIRHWMYANNKTGLKLIDYDKMLFPQYEDSFDKTITSDIWKLLQKQAKENLLNKSANSNVIAHWKSIADGNVPFGYAVK